MEGGSGRCRTLSRRTTPVKSMFERRYILKLKSIILGTYSVCHAIWSQSIWSQTCSVCHARTTMWLVRILVLTSQFVWGGHLKGLMTQWRLSEERIGIRYRFQRQYNIAALHMGSVMAFATNPGKPHKRRIKTRLSSSWPWIVQRSGWCSILQGRPRAQIFQWSEWVLGPHK